MKTYELTYIISSSLTGSESDEAKKKVEDLILEKGGTALKSEKTQAQPLSYVIKKHSSGYFVIMTFEVAEDKIKEIKAYLEKEANILRHLFVIKKPFKEMKARRTKKPIPAKDKVENSVFVHEEKKDEGKVELEDINKKLDEILSE